MFMKPKVINFAITTLIIISVTSFLSLAQTSETEDTSQSWVAPESANKLQNPLKGIIESAKKGGKLFNQICFECHGDNGGGDGPSAYMFDPKPANLASKKVQEQSDGALFWKISEGNGAMPSNKETFTEKERWQLVNFIRYLAKKKND